MATALYKPVSQSQYKVQATFLLRQLVGLRDLLVDRG